MKNQIEYSCQGCNGGELSCIALIPISTAPDVSNGPPEACLFSGVPRRWQLVSNPDELEDTSNE